MDILKESLNKSFNGCIIQAVYYRGYLESFKVTYPTGKVIYLQPDYAVVPNAEALEIRGD